MQEKIFADLLVVELAAVLAGPAVGMFFAELGARVIKVENARTGGDMTRRWKVPAEDPRQAHSAYYCSVNWGKEVWMKDLTQPEQRKEVLELIDRADIVISNFRPAAARKLGMEAATLRARNPRLIVGVISGFGPGDNRPAFDLVLQAEAGFLSMCGEPDRPPSKMPVALIDLLAAHQLKEGVLTALFQRERTGKGATVEVPLYASALASLANQATNYLMANHVPQRMGTQHPNIAPYGEWFVTKDGKELVLAVGTNPHFAALCHSLELPHLIEHELFVDNEKRVAHREVLAGILRPVIGRHTMAELEAKLMAQNVPIGRVRTLDEVFADPVARELILEEEMPDGTVSKRVRTVVFALVE